MTRILLRAAQSPFANHTGFQTFIHDKIWSNLGNLLFSHSVFKALYSKNVQIDIMDKDASAYTAGEINEKYDFVVLPFANAFRSDFAKKLQNYTNLIQKLTIPVVVPGIGMQAPVQSQEHMNFGFDPQVKAFMKAVLEHSACVGVRGSVTYDYLCNLGFKEHTQIIGCPSMYTFGDTLPAQPTNKVSHAAFRVNLNGKRADSERIKHYLFTSGENAAFYPQTTKELEMLYTGRTIDASEQFYPASLNSKTLRTTPTSICFPLSVRSWIESLRRADMSIGTRIHGSVASVLSGLPTFVICTDSRVLELAEYHEIPHCLESEFNDERSIYEIYQQTDFTSVYANHKQRYENYVEFMKKNGLTVQKPPFTDFYEKFNTIAFNTPVIPLTNTEPAEMLHRLNAYYRLMDKQRMNLKRMLDAK